MGCGNGQSSKSPSTLAIEKQLKEDGKLLQKTTKLLLLGAGESGKSTFAKQIRIIHLGGFTEEERLRFKEVIYENILYSIHNLIEASELHKLKLDSSNKQRAESIKEAITINKSLGDSIKKLYSDPAIQTCLGEKYQTFHLLDSAKYFFEHLTRLTASDYIPSVEDLLRCRAKTTGIQELHLEIENRKFIIVDVGGQRSERKKWIHCFQDVTAVLFFVALSEYDLSLYEDDETNRMHESLKLFDEICNSRWFNSIPIVLFLNKKDLFEDKIKKVNITVAFPDYEGKQEFQEAADYIKDQFIALNENPEKQIFPHIVCATDTSNIQAVFDAVKHIVLTKAIQNIGL